jgi:hypothetical protein
MISNDTIWYFETSEPNFFKIRNDTMFIYKTTFTHDLIENLYYESQTPLFWYKIKKHSYNTLILETEMDYIFKLKKVTKKVFFYQW